VIVADNLRATVRIVRSEREETRSVGDAQAMTGIDIQISFIIFSSG